MRRRPAGPVDARSITACAWLGPPFLLATLIVLTIRQSTFLANQGWDPIGRTGTQWPSLLALGPGGWMLLVAFLVGSATAALLALSIWMTERRPGDRVLIAACLALALGLVTVAFPADLPDAPLSWHATIHNAGYPLIPLAIMVGAFVTSRRPVRRRPIASRALLLVIVVAYPLTGTEAIGQASRYVLFAALMAWVLLLTWTQWSRTARHS